MAKKGQKAKNMEYAKWLDKKFVQFSSPASSR